MLQHFAYIDLIKPERYIKFKINSIVFLIQKGAVRNTKTWCMMKYWSHKIQNYSIEADLSVANI
jgi:hypothetical protein